MLSRLKVLFLCTGNSCRSQMAEAWARVLHPDRVEALSAGTRPGTLDPRAVQVMAESGIDMITHRAKNVGTVDTTDLDLVVTVCDRARDDCPVLPAAVRHLHAGFPDPPSLAADVAGEDKVLDVYRQVRDQIRAFVHKLPSMADARSGDASREPDAPSGKGGPGGQGPFPGEPA